jgi:hypothetical protein
MEEEEGRLAKEMNNMAASMVGDEESHQCNSIRHFWPPFDM